MITKKWIESFIAITTKKWDQDDSSNSNILPGTGWLGGVSNLEIKKMERNFGFRFPNDVKILLSVTKGLNKKQKQVGYIGTKEITKFVYSWHLIPQRIDDAIKFTKSWTSRGTYEIIKEENLIPTTTQESFFLLPIYSHRFVVCDQNNPTLSIVLSIYDQDIVIYGKDLRDYLENEFID